MTTRHEQRKRRADELAEPSYFFSYVLQLDDGSYYVGSTNAPYARWTEHAIGNGAKATAGQRFTIRMVAPFLSRREAEYNERRLQQALEDNPASLEALLTVFDQMVNVVRPPKTFSQLREEEERYDREMQTVMHHSRAVLGTGGQTPTACGYPVTYYASGDWEELKKMARDEDYTGNIYGRKVCRRCLEHAPQE